MTRPFFTEALLLRAVPYGEADVVATLLTPDRGRMTALAKSARKSRRRFGGALDYFCLLRAEVRPSLSGMPKLLGVELLKSYETVRGDLARYAAGSHFLEVARLGTREEDPSPEPYAVLAAALEALDAGADPKSLPRLFQIRMLGALGYGFSVEACARCGAELPPGGVSFDDFGPACAACAGRGAAALSAGARKTLAAAAEVPPERFGALRIGAALDAELRPLVEGALVRALGVEPKSLRTLFD